MNNKYDENDYKKKDVLLELLNKGMTPKQIGDMFNVHRANISYYLKKNNISWLDYE